RPADAVWGTVTVVARSCVEANAASTAAVILGADAPAWLEARCLPARLVHADGAIVRVAGWPPEEPDATRRRARRHAAPNRASNKLSLAPNGVAPNGGAGGTAA